MERHARNSARCILVEDPSEVLVSVVSDGAGSASFGRQGSAVVCRTISECTRKFFSNSTLLPTDDEVWAWIDLARDRIGAAARRRSSELRQFAATLVAVCATQSETMVLHIGDGAAVIRSEGCWQVPSWPAHGEYASTTYFVTDEPSPRLQIVRLPLAVDGLAVFSDGLERLVLSFGEQIAHAPFFNSMLKPIEATRTKGRLTPIGLKRYLDSAAVNERTDDDKSLILAART